MRLRLVGVGVGVGVGSLVAALTLPLAAHAAGGQAGWDPPAGVAAGGPGKVAIASGNKLHWPVKDPAYVEGAASAIRKRGLALSVLGGIAAYAGTMLMVGEYMLRPKPGFVGVWRREGCIISFTAGFLLVPWGVHMLSAGIALVIRGGALEELASGTKGVGLVDPSLWLGPRATGVEYRASGAILAIVGTAMVSSGLELYLPVRISGDYECRAWPDFGDCFESRDDRWLRGVSVALSAVGGALVAVGLVLAAVGHAKRPDVTDGTDDASAAAAHGAPIVSVLPAPGGLAVVW